jgi:PIN domain nuclease of toxin-antitoxin system
MIFLDTNAWLWWGNGHKRTAHLKKWQGKMSVSPVSLLEIQMLIEFGHVKLPCSPMEFANASDVEIDAIDATELFEEARHLSWTREPFDRLIVTHVQIREMKLATSDQHIISSLEKRFILEL